MIDGDPDFVLPYELVDRAPQGAMGGLRQGHAALGLDENPARVGGHGVDVVDGRSRLQAEFNDAGRAWKIESPVRSRT